MLQYENQKVCIKDAYLWKKFLYYQQCIHHTLVWHYHIKIRIKNKEVVSHLTLVDSNANHTKENAKEKHSSAKHVKLHAREVLRRRLF